MKEDEAGMRHLGPLVKADLANLDADGESRRIALKSLKQFVEQLDTASMSRFLTQVAESRESGGSRSYAISLYEEVARVHGKLIIPHIPRVTSSLIRSLSGSGSSPQLQQACAKVTAALAQHSIDATTSPGEAENIIHEICDPLADALAGKLEPVAAGAAACIHAVVETEKWKYASHEVIHEVCQRTSVALSEKNTRTVAHMQLVQALAAVNPDILSIYGANLLRTGEEILKGAANPWQHRKAAAKLLQSVLTILDKRTLELELDSALHALDSCRLDRMPHVRAAVSEALHTAKMLASGDPTRTSVGIAASPVRKSNERGRGGWNEDALLSPASKRGHSPRSPASSISASESRQIPSSPAWSTGRRPKRTPLHSARGMGFVQSPRSASSPSTSPSSSITEECESPSHRLGVKENVRGAGMNGAHSQKVGVQGNFKYVPPRAPVTSGGVYTPMLPTQLDTFGSEPPKISAKKSAKEFTHRTKTSDMESVTESETDSIAGDCDDGGLAEVDNVRPPGAGNGLEVNLPRLRVGNPNSPDHINASTSRGGLLQRRKNSGMNAIMQGTVDEDGANGDVEVEKREVLVSTTDVIRSAQHLATGMDGINDKKSMERLVSPAGRSNILAQHYNALAHLHGSPQEERSTPILSGKDFLPFATPKRLMLALQTSQSSPKLRDCPWDRDMRLSQDDAVPSSRMMMAHTPLVDMDLETSSETGWSVRDNPIASEESFQPGSSDDECKPYDQRSRGGGVYEAFAYPRKVTSADGVSPREIHIVSPFCRKTDNESSATADDCNGNKNVASNRRVQECDLLSDQTHCPSCVMDESKPRVWTLSHHQASSAAKDLTSEAGRKPGSNNGGLSSLLRSDELKKNGLFCGDCGSEASDGGSVTEVELSADDDEEEIDSFRKPVAERSRRSWWERGLTQFLFVRLMKRNWRRWSRYVEVFLGGSLCVILALPLAMVIARALTPPREIYLVPT